MAEVLKESSFLAECAEYLHAATESANILQKRLTGRINVLDNDHLPAVSLPVEILGEIFAFGIPIGEGWVDMDRYTSYLGCITSVCRKWRMAALETPRLWNTISCNPDRLFAHNAFPTTRTFGNMEHLLFLSKQAPLRVYAHFEYLDATSIHSPAIVSLLPHLHRLQELTITIDRESPFISILFGLGLPALSRLSLSVDGDDDTSDGLPELLAPNTLKYLSIYVRRRPSSLPIYYSKLAANVTELHLDIPPTSIADLLLILGHAPLVVWLSLEEHREGLYPRPATETGLLVLPRLASFEYVTSNGLDIFSHIHMPILETLNITDHSAVKLPWGGYSIPCRISGMSSPLVFTLLRW